MRGFCNLLRSIVLSPELAATVILVLAWWLYPPPFVWVDSAIEKLEWISLLGVFGAITVFCAGLCWKILFPAKNAAALCRWQRYPYLRTTTIVGLAFAVSGAITGAIGVLGRGSLTEGMPSLLLVIGYMVSGIAALTMLIAALTVRSITNHGN